MKPVLDGTLTTFEPTVPGTKRWNDWIQKRLANSVWTQCQSWYRVGAEGKIFSTFPGAMALYWWMARSPRWDDYIVQGPGKGAWERKKKVKTAVRVAECLALSAAATLWHLTL